MDSLHSTMNQHVKGKHLSFEERVIIQPRLKDGCSIRAISRELGCSPSTISYEVRRGTVSLYHGKQKRYKADQGQSVYQINRCHCGRKSAFLKKAGFINYVIKHFFEDGRSLDVCANRSLATGEFSHYQTVCTRILPASCRLFKCFKKQYSEHWNDIFKTITTDNGSEFADLANLEQVSKTLIYYAYTYTSCDKGTVERHNGLIRRFIPKGDCINNYFLQQIIDIETWCNSLPRKILAYHTPDEIFERELDQIYQAA
ncbi:transposase [Lactobacillus helveticus]|uniref:Transposase n=1 Tax=Lactobacillus helveticus TaxID=1587 RepID=A0A386REZ5_LACHE|nr:IS30 family transposase [Lactobacillus helveticus]AYE61701.1 transposase [Lactobacillus helveticus]